MNLHLAPAPLVSVLAGILILIMPLALLCGLQDETAPALLVLRVEAIMIGAKVRDQDVRARRRGKFEHAVEQIGQISPPLDTHRRAIGRWPDMS